MRSGRQASQLLALPVRIHGIHLGRPVDVLLDPTLDRVVGFEVACGDGARRFLPFAVAEIREDEIAAASALAVVDERELEYYRRNSRRLSELALTDPWIDPDGVVHEARSAA
jgi:hypothetical protein